MHKFEPINPNGSLNLEVNLGRRVITPEAVLQVIRPDLRMTRAIYRGVLASMREGWLACTEDQELTDGGDQHSEDVVYEALRDSALQNVRDYCRDMDLVFDADHLQEFIRLAICNAMVTVNGIEMLPEGALEY